MCKSSREKVKSLQSVYVFLLSAPQLIWQSVWQTAHSPAILDFGVAIQSFTHLFAHSCQKSATVPSNPSAKSLPILFSHLAVCFSVPLEFLQGSHKRRTHFSGLSLCRPTNMRIRFRLRLFVSFPNRSLDTTWRQFCPTMTT